MERTSVLGCYFWTWRQSVVPNDAPRDFGPEVAFGAKFQIPVARQKGTEMLDPRPYVTEPFRPLSSINSWYQFLYIQQHSSYFLHVVRPSVSCGGAHWTIADALLQKNSCLWFIAIISLVSSILWSLQICQPDYSGPKPYLGLILSLDNWIIIICCRLTSVLLGQPVSISMILKYCWPCNKTANSRETK